jgi:hypothetical protein
VAKYNTKPAKKIKHKCAPVCRIHVSFSINQQLARFGVTIFCVTVKGSEMQSGALASRMKNQKQLSKPQYNKISVTKFKQKRAPISRIHVSFG